MTALIGILICFLQAHLAFGKKTGAAPILLVEFLICCHFAGKGPTVQQSLSLVMETDFKPRNIIKNMESFAFTVGDWPTILHRNTHVFEYITATHRPQDAQVKGFFFHTFVNHLFEKQHPNVGGQFVCSNNLQLGIYISRKFLALSFPSEACCHVNVSHKLRLKV